MLVNRISGADNTYRNQNNVAFQSKFVPNKALEDAFYIAKVNIEYGKNYEKFYSRSFAKIIDNLLNDGKDNLIKVTRAPKSSSLIINDKRVNLYHSNPPSEGFVDGERVIVNIVDYFIKKGVEFSKLSRDEFKAIKPSVDKLNADLNADDVTKNPQIFYNLEENMQNINVALHKHTAELLDKLEAKIFNK